MMFSFIIFLFHLYSINTFDTDIQNSQLNAEFILDLQHKENNNFSIEVNIGEPKQTLNLLIDINSEFSFIKVPNCQDENCLDELDQIEQSLFNYDSTKSKTNELIEKNANFLFNKKEYKADIVKDSLSLSVENKNFELKNFHFFLLKENLNIYADGILGLNPYIISNRYILYNFIEHARYNNLISNKIFALDLLNKNKAKLYLGKNNFKNLTNNNTNNNNSLTNYSIYEKFNTNKEFVNNNNNLQNKNFNFISNKNSFCKIKSTYFLNTQSKFHLINRDDISQIEKDSIAKKINFNWTCKSTHLLIGDENNYYKAISLENYLVSEKKRNANKDLNSEFFSKHNNDNSINLILNENINIEFSTSIKNLIVDKRFLNLFFENYAKKISEEFSIKDEGNIFYIILEKQFFRQIKIPSLNFIINGFSYKILSEDLFEEIFENGKIYYRLLIEFKKIENNLWQFGYIFMKNNLMEFNKEKNLVDFYLGVKKDLSKFISDENENFCFYNVFIYFFIFSAIGYCMFYVYNRDNKKEINYLKMSNEKKNFNPNLNRRESSAGKVFGFNKHYSLKLKDEDEYFRKSRASTKNDIYLDHKFDSNLLEQNEDKDIDNVRSSKKENDFNASFNKKKVQYKD